MSDYERLKRYEKIYPFQIDLLIKQFMNYYSAGPCYDKWNTNLLFQQLDIAEVITQDICCLLNRIDEPRREEFITLQNALIQFIKISDRIDTCINIKEICVPDTQLGQIDVIDLKKVVSDSLQYTIDVVGYGELERYPRGMEKHVMSHRFVH